MQPAAGTKTVLAAGFCFSGILLLKEELNFDNGTMIEDAAIVLCSLELVSQIKLDLAGCLGHMYDPKGFVTRP